MRPIKFRAWDKENNKMIINPNAGLVYGERINSAFTDDSMVYMQYTGLKDKNGVEIYEGDILRWTDELNEVDDYQVIYQAPSFKYSHLHNPEYMGATRPFDELEADKDFEVIGNIYENKELLK